MRKTMVVAFARALFVAGCLASALAAAGLKPQPLHSGPLEERTMELAGRVVAIAFANGRASTSSGP
jgi:hypothetical protein